MSNQCLRIYYYRCQCDAYGTGKCDYFTPDYRDAKICNDAVVEHGRWECENQDAQVDADDEELPVERGE